MSNTLRLAKELQDIKRDPDPSIHISYDDHDVRDVNALLIGPAQTPYACGIFEFSLLFPSTYPQHPPKVKLMTTDGGRTRFSPNLYASGKVCLSILNTWRGEPWTSALGVSSCLTSMLSLMSENPYQNEPGFEDCGKDDKDAVHYAEKIEHETLRITVIHRLERYLGWRDKQTVAHTSATTPGTPDPYYGVPSTTMAEAGFNNEPTAKRQASTEVTAHHSADFKDLCVHIFLVYFDQYRAICGKGLARGNPYNPHDEPFVISAFEHSNNVMAGSFNYSHLWKSLEMIVKSLDHETFHVWKQRAKLAIAEERGIVHCIRTQFEQCRSHFANVTTGLVDVSLDDDQSCFAWKITIYGNPMSRLDGGVIRARLDISTDFPNVQPRIRILTKLFHPNINCLGVAYLPRLESSELKEYIDCVKNFLEREPESHPSARLNVEASEMYWGPPDQRQAWSRRFRRCLQDSAEEF